MKTLLKSLLLLVIFSLSSCSEDSNPFTGNNGLSDSEIAEGLKEALKVGTDTSTAILSQTGGYLQDQAVKILLPDGVNSQINDFRSKSFTVLGVTVTGDQLYNGYNNSLLGLNIPGLKSKEDEIIVGINTAAEQAAATAAPIFVGAIEDITIEDANNILFGGNETAATDYLEGKTSSLLFNEYEPKIDAALQSVTVGGESVVNAYEGFVQDYNDILNTSVGIGTIGSLMNVQTIAASDISEHSTQKGLDGLFLKISEEEADIRQDPLARVNSILQKVFGELD